MKDALERCGQLLPGIMQLDDDLQLLREVRNGVAHLGLAAERADELLVPFLRASEILLDELGENEFSYFGNKKRWVDETLARDPKKAFAQRYKSMEPAWREQVLVGLVSAYGDDGLLGHLRPCPACGTDGLVFGTISPDYEVESETKHGGTAMYASLTAVEFYAEEFECKACGLVLHGPEIAAAGMQAKWELQDVDETLLRQWERDWDDV